MPVLDVYLICSSLLLCRDAFGKGAEVVQKLSECCEDGAMLADILTHLFYLPVRHLHEYGHLLLKLATCYEVVGTQAHWLCTIVKVQLF